MKVLKYLGCLVIGHNKVLEHWIEGGHDTYFTVCTQCSKHWRMVQLNKKPKMVIKTHTIKMLAQGKRISKPVAKEIRVPMKIKKKQLVNIYLI